ncbi:MAG: DUF2065 family protein [Nitrosomonadales bacterium]
MKQTFILAIGLLFIVEGIVPFAFPGFWKKILTALENYTEGQLRMYGLVLILIGLVIINLG